MNQITIPLLRKIIPGNIAREIVSVQPMTGVAGNIFTIRGPVSNEFPPYQGELKHSFFYGWLRYYGTEWIPAPLWWKIKVRGL